jgi:hypothetical protein
VRAATTVQSLGAGCFTSVAVTATQTRSAEAGKQELQLPGKSTPYPRSRTEIAARSAVVSRPTTASRAVPGLLSSLGTSSLCGGDSHRGSRRLLSRMCVLPNHRSLNRAASGLRRLPRQELFSVSAHQSSPRLATAPSWPLALSLSTQPRCRSVENRKPLRL